ncbi:hypothetical protein [Gymnodinialimonas sp. 57CJ19]|uniref:hypothetical protein n=1 Tax=Gymnodinialimonas sp. 57CJ19 TaxID=3138498 RepID=UPI00313445B8
MMATLRHWGRRAFGIFLCVGCWLIAMGLFSLGQGWFVDTFGIHDIGDLVLHAIVRVLGATGGAIFFAIAGTFALWLFLVAAPAEEGDGADRPRS